MQKKVEIEQGQLILREFDFENDPAKIVKYVFTGMNSPEGIQALKDQAEIFKDPYNVRLVAELDGKLIATCALEPSMGPNPTDRFNLFSVVTAEKYRGTKVSGLMFEFACEWVKQFGARLLLVSTNRTNIAARKFFEKVGFVKWGVLPNAMRENDGFVDEIYYYFSF